MGTNTGGGPAKTRHRQVVRGVWTVFVTVGRDLDASYSIRTVISSTSWRKEATSVSTERNRASLSLISGWSYTKTCNFILFFIQRKCSTESGNPVPDLLLHFFISCLM